MASRSNDEATLVQTVVAYSVCLLVFKVQAAVWFLQRGFRVRDCHTLVASTCQV